MKIFKSKIGIIIIIIIIGLSILFRNYCNNGDCFNYILDNINDTNREIFSLFSFKEAMSTTPTQPFNITYDFSTGPAAQKQTAIVTTKNITSYMNLISEAGFVKNRRNQDIPNLVLYSKHTKTIKHFIVTITALPTFVFDITSIKSDIACPTGSILIIDTSTKVKIFSGNVKVGNSTINLPITNLTNLTTLTLNIITTGITKSNRVDHNFYLGNFILTGTMRNLDDISKSITTQPVTTQPVTTQPVTTELVTTQPVTTQPVTTQDDTEYDNDMETTQPVYMETTQPVYMETTQPVYMETTQPVYMETTQPVYMETTQPVYMETTQPVYMQTTQPVYMETTQPAYMETTQSAYMQTTQPAYMQTTQPAYMQTTQPAYMQTTQPFITSYVSNKTFPPLTTPDTSMLNKTTSAITTDTNSDYLFLSSETTSDIKPYNRPPIATSINTTTMPGTTMSATSINYTTMPGTTMPGTTMPGTTMPGTTMPRTTMPRTTMPRTTMTESSEDIDYDNIADNIEDIDYDNIANNIEDIDPVKVADNLENIYGYVLLGQN